MPLLAVCLSFLMGVLIAEELPLTWTVLAFLAGILIAFTVVDRLYLTHHPAWMRLRSHLPVAPSLLLIFLLAGMLRFQLTTLPAASTDLAYYNDQGKFSFTAWVSAPPDVRENTVYLQVKVTDIEDPYETDPAKVIRAIRGKAQIKLPAGADYRYGDILHFDGTPCAPSDDSDFSYKQYLSRMNIHTIFYYPGSLTPIGHGQGSRLLAVLENARQAVRRVIFRQFPQPESGLLAGVLLGLDNDLPNSLEAAYQATGTAHIIAISGSNMALLAGVMVVFLSRFMQKKWVLLVTAPVLVLYTLFVGGSPSVIRSAVMSILAFGGYLVGRKGAGMTALFLTAAVMCLLNPQVISDAGFQLSFAATLGLLLFAGPLQQGAKNLLSRFLPAEKAAKVASPLSAYLLFTLAAQVTTLPVIALHFKRISLSSLFANPLILPAQPFLLGFGGLSAILGTIHPLAGKISALLAWPLLAYTNRVVELLGKLKWGSLNLHPGMAPWLLGFLIAFILLFVFRDIFKKKFGKGFAWLVFALLLACVSVWSIALHQPDGRLHLQVMRAGDETALFVRAPGGEALLFDPSGEVNEVSAAVARELSPWNFHLDDVWLTRPINGSTLQLLDERITINRVLLSPLVAAPNTDQPKLVLPAGMTSCELSIGEVVTYIEGFKVQLLTADLEHTAVYMIFGDTTILVPNGVDFARIREIGPQALAHPSVLVLSEADISYIPPRVWDQADAAIVLWNSTALSPREDWIGLGENKGIEVISDGKTTPLTLDIKK